MIRCQHLVVVHFHLRPGGVRRVIELTLPAIARRLGLRRITLASGEAVEPAWLRHLRASLKGIEVVEVVEREFGYVSEQSAQHLRERLAKRVPKLLADADALWLHNPSLARNVPLVEALNAEAVTRGIPQIYHHHDFWFDNRWARWPELRACGYRSLDAVARVIFPPAPVHIAINRLDLEQLASGSGLRAEWLPNPAATEARPSQNQIRLAQRWLANLIGRKTPAWVFPTRLLRRKNMAEAVLLTRWLRPDAWLITTAAVSSEDEAAYARKLIHAARKNQWKVHFGALAGSSNRTPSVSALMAAAEAVVLTSVQEGFGLPYLEATAVGRPLIGRALPNVLPDLKRLGLKLPHLYDDVWIATECFDFAAERRRQESIWRAWRGSLPVSVRGMAEPPAILDDVGASVPFSRLTLSAQLEVLAHPPEATWSVCAPHNRALRTIARAIESGSLRAGEWPEKAVHALSMETYAARFAAALGRAGTGQPGGAAELQRNLIRQRLGRDFVYPILIE